jgi:hypothetical protein
VMGFARRFAAWANLSILARALLQVKQRADVQEQKEIGRCLSD